LQLKTTLVKITIIYNIQKHKNIISFFETKRFSNTTKTFLEIVMKQLKT